MSKRAERRWGEKEQPMSAKESKISGLVKRKDSWKDNTDGQATQFVHSHMHVLVLV